MFLADVNDFFSHFDNPGVGIRGLRTYFFNRVVMPMYTVWTAYKATRILEAHALCNMISAEDWRAACVAWLEGTNAYKSATK
jgi:hypothetical protein